MKKTVKDIIGAVNLLKPNEFAPEQLTAWLNEVEGTVQSRICRIDPSSAGFRTYDYAVDENSEAIVPPPYDVLYVYYLMAKIDLAYEDYDKYANDGNLYNAAFNDYAKWHQRTFNHLSREVNNADV